MEQYIKQLIFGFLLFTIVNGAPGAGCQDRLASCLQKVTKDFSMEDLPVNDFKAMLEKLGQIDYCEVYRGFQQCYDDLKAECADQIDKQVLEPLQMFKDQFRCDLPGAGKCVMEINKCGIDAFLVSGITQDDLSKIQVPSMTVLANPIELLTQILGAEKGCKFIESYGKCALATVGECSAIPFLRTTLGQLEVASKNLKCH